MNKFNKILLRAYTSAFWLKVFNFIMNFKIPFNAPHRFKIQKISEEEIQVRLPYIRKNLNHLNGIHACALATASEYACGLLIISRLNPDRYRLIMRSLHMDYVKQGKEDVYIHFKMNADELQEIKSDLEKNHTFIKHFKVEARTLKGDLISIATLEWQLKDWRKVK